MLQQKRNAQLNRNFLYAALSRPENIEPISSNLAL